MTSSTDRVKVIINEQLKHCPHKDLIDNKIFNIESQFLKLEKLSSKIFWYILGVYGAIAVQIAIIIIQR